MTIFFYLGAFAQKFTIDFIDISNDSSSIDQKLLQIDLRDPKDTAQLKSLLPTVKRNLQKQGYLAVSIDSFVTSNDTIFVQTYLGQKIEYGNIQWVGIDSNWFNRALLRNYSLKNKSPSAEYLKNTAEIMLRFLEEKGYPLSFFELEDSSIENDSLNATISLEKGPFIRFGDIDLLDSDIIQVAFMQRYLGTKLEAPYQKSLITNIPTLIDELPYLQLKSAPAVKVVNNRAIIELDLEEKKASQFDFLIGVLPNVGNTERQFTIFGELTAEFKNKLHRGEELYVHFRQLKPETQRIDFRFAYPYILQLPFGLHSSFSLYKNGINTIDMNAEIGIEYQTVKKIKAQFYTQFASSRILQIDTVAILNSRQLPTSLDVRSNDIGFRISRNRLDYTFNPRKGWRYGLDVSGGIRTLIPNRTILTLESTEVDYSLAYDSLQLQSFQSDAISHLQYFIPIRKNATVLLENKTAVKWSQNTVYLNEYYRIGGSSSIRGFDEESLRAQYYTFFTAEFRYLLGLNSYFSVFTDYAWIYNDFRSSGKVWDPVLGFGAGLSFQTKAGIFGLKIALGREQSNPIDFRNAKTHFGFISLF